MSTPEMTRRPAGPPATRPIAAKARKIAAVVLLAATAAILYLGSSSPAGRAFRKMMPTFFSTIRSFFSGFTPAQIAIAVLFLVGLVALAVLAPEHPDNTNR
jgi:hypothetical protein